MARTSDTYGRAYDCCEELFLSSGRLPTVEMVKQEIATNSPAVIKRAINDWLLHYTQQQADKLARPQLPAALLTAVEAIWKKATVEAEKVYEQRAQELALIEQQDKSRIAALENSLVEKEAHWLQEKLALQEDIDQRTQTLSGIMDELEDAVKKVHELKQSLAETCQTLSGAEGALNEARIAQESQAKEWTLKFEQDHSWHLKRIEEEKDALKRQFAKTMADQNRHIETAKLEHEMQNVRMNQIICQMGESLSKQTQLDEENQRLNVAVQEKEKMIGIQVERIRKLQGVLKTKMQKQKPVPLPTKSRLHDDSKSSRSANS